MAFGSGETFAEWKARMDAMTPEEKETLRAERIRAEEDRRMEAFARWEAAGRPEGCTNPWCSDDRVGVKTPGCGSPGCTRPPISDKRWMTDKEWWGD